MIARFLIECPVCKQITVLRIQAGFLPSHSIRFNCGNCKISLYGEAFFKPPNVNIKMDRGNVVKTIDTPNFLLAVSGELLSSKLQPVKTFEDIGKIPSPFMNLFSLIGYENYNKFKEHILGILDFIPKYKNQYIICNQLYFLKQNIYLKESLLDFVNHENVLNNELDLYSCLHRHINRFFYVTINPDEAEAIATLVFKEMEDYMKYNIDELLKLVKYFNISGLLEKWEYNIFQLSSQIIENIDKFIPIIGQKYYSLDIDELEKDYSINTLSFEEIEPIYFKCYELLSDMLPIVMAYNNLKYRNNFDIIKSGIKFRNKEIKSLSEYIEIDSKGFRIDCINGTELFDNIVYNQFDRTIRNSIGHFNYEILAQDVFNRTILFKNLKNPNKNETRSLLKISIDLWKMFLAINNLGELIYQTKKMSYIVIKGMKPTI